MAKKGKISKSPKLMHKIKLEAERNIRKAKKSTCNAKTMKDLLDKT